MVKIDPFAHHRRACRMRNTCEALAVGKLRQDLPGKGVLHAAGNIIDPHLVGEAHVLTEIEVFDLQIERGIGILDERSGQSAIGVCIGDTPAMNEDEQHAEYSPGGEKWRDRCDFRAPANATENKSTLLPCTRLPEGGGTNVLDACG